VQYAVNWFTGREGAATGYIKEPLVSGERGEAS
jgi:hypothetical protein